MRKLIHHMKKSLKWYFTLERPKKCAIFTFQWHITENCNLRCKHCYQEGCKPQMSFEQMQDVLKNLKQFADDLKKARKLDNLKVNVTLTGGEPLLHPDFWRLAEKIVAEDSFMLTVLTNGTLIDEKTAKRLSWLKPYFVQVSIDGNEKVHDSIRGQGNYKRAVQGLKYLINNNVNTSMSFTVHKGNREQFKDVVLLGESIGVNRVWSDRLIPTGSGTDLEMLTPQETQEFYLLMKSLHDEVKERGTKTHVHLGRALQFLAGGTPYKCNAGNMLLTLMPNGDIYPCRRMPIEVGNIFDLPLTSYYNKRNGILMALRTETVSCGGCEHSPRCNGGLRCLANTVNNDPFTSDPGCWIKK